MATTLNPGLVDTDGQTPTLGGLLRTAVTNGLLATHTMLPGEIVTVKDNHLVNVQPLIKEKLLNNTAPIALPILQDVFVVSPRGATYGLKLPIAVGDTGILIFAERSLDVWSTQGGLVDPLDGRHHTLSDAVFVPGLYPFNAPIPAPMGAKADELVVYNALAQIYLQPNGAFKITNGTFEVLQLLLNTMQQLQQSLTALSATTVATLLGPQPLSSAALLATASAQVATLIVELTPMVGS